MASSNSGPGGGDDRNDDHDDDRQTTTPSHDSSVVTTIITIPQDAESHSAANPYSPNPATVSSGSTVTWNNVDDEDAHTATADDGSFTTGIINPGSSGQAVIDAVAGTTIPYHCDVHPEMRGILQVSAAATGVNAPEGNAADTLQTESIDLNGTLQISDRPFAVGHYRNVTENFANNTLRVTITGNTTITLPNSTEIITTNDTGNVTITFTEFGDAILHGQVYLTTEDGLENATIIMTEFFSSEDTPGRGIASFSTDSTGRLAPLDSVVAVTLDEDEPDGSVQVSFFEWYADPLVDNNQAETVRNSTSGNQTTSPATGQDGDSVIEVSITSASSSKTTNAYAPNPINANVGSTVTWTNRDSTPHTVTSGTAGMLDGKFDSSPGFNPLLASQQTFSHTFTEAGEYPYYCGLHPNMVGTVNVS